MTPLFTQCNSTCSKKGHVSAESASKIIVIFSFSNFLFSGKKLPVCSSQQVWQVMPCPGKSWSVRFMFGGVMERFVNLVTCAQQKRVRAYNYVHVGTCMLDWRRTNICQWRAKVMTHDFIYFVFFNMQNSA